MNKLRATLLISMGIFASGSGIIQVSAADYVFFTDFSTKTVANFNDYNPTFLSDTYGLDNRISWTFNTFYRMDACPPSIATNMNFIVSYAINNGSQFNFISEALPDMPCTVGDTYYQITGSASVPSEVFDAVVSDDANYVVFRPSILFGYSGSAPSRVITLTGAEFVFSLEYDFDTTYLFNYFLSDSQYRFTSFDTGITIPGTVIHDFDYVMTTAGDDRYFIINSATTNYGTTRTKWAIDYNNEYFRGESIGARYKIIIGNATVSWPVAATRAIVPRVDYYFLNAANKEQDIGIVPEFEYEYEDCGWNVFDIPCFINNGIAYVVNDAPVVSDAFTLLNAGMKLGGQAFSVIGQFSDNNLFGVLILGGLGITAVRWFLKND
jgi:hypothetical protein